MPHPPKRESPAPEPPVSAPSVEEQPGKPEHFEEVRIENPVTKPYVPIRHVGRAKRTLPPFLHTFERKAPQHAGTFGTYEPFKDPAPTPLMPNESDVDSSGFANTVEVCN